MSAHAQRAGAPRLTTRARPPVAAAGALLPLPAARLAGFAGLALFAASQWARMLAPAATGRLAGVLAATLALCLVLAVVAHRRPGLRVRLAVTVAGTAALLPVLLLVSGVPDELLAPRGLGDLGSGLEQGLGALANTKVPYRGLEEWTRTVLVGGGCLLVGIAGLLAFAPRRDGRLGFPIAAATVLGVLYGVPAVLHDGELPFLKGLAFALLLVVFLCLERVERRALPLAGALVAGAAVVALVAAPRVEGETPLVDFKQFAELIGDGRMIQYDWNHGYGPLKWPREGREVLRVKARRKAYWKATELVTFDGAGWTEDARAASASLSSALPEPRREWTETIQVTVRALRSQQFVAAGTTLQISRSPRAPVQKMPGVYETADRPLRRGHAYRARVYLPRPRTAELRRAGAAYPLELQRSSTTMLLAPPAPRRGSAPGPAQGRARRPDRIVAFPLFGSPGRAMAFSRIGAATSAVRAFADSDYAGVYALARRLRAGADTPYEYMRAVERHLARDFEYSETPPASPAPLADFLLRERAGYCQQFSGAMALLMRMGGVPARVATGFSPGTRDDRRDEYVVRDLDAHSWVEVYFPGIGWVTRDPTPAASPARDQTADNASGGAASDATLPGARQRGLEDPLGDVGTSRAGDEAGAASDDGSIPWPAIGLGALFVVVSAGVAARVRRGADPPVAELPRALARMGRPLPADTTLEALARRYAGTPGEPYLRAASAARFTPGGTEPTTAQRAGLRRSLAAGSGLRGRVRAWWALPPRV